MSKYMYEENEIVCNFLNCAAGMGVAGSGICFLKGEADNKDCKQFKPDEDFQKEQEDSSRRSPNE